MTETLFKITHQLKSFGYYARLRHQRTTTDCDLLDGSTSQAIHVCNYDRLLPILVYYQLRDGTPFADKKLITHGNIDLQINLPTVRIVFGGPIFGGATDFGSLSENEVESLHDGDAPEGYHRILFANRAQETRWLDMVRLTWTVSPGKNGGMLELPRVALHTLGVSGALVEADEILTKLGFEPPSPDGEPLTETVMALDRVLTGCNRHTAETSVHWQTEALSGMHIGTTYCLSDGGRSRMTWSCNERSILKPSWDSTESVKHRWEWTAARDLRLRVEMMLFRKFADRMA